MMKPQRGFPLRGPGAGSTGARLKPRTSLLARPAFALHPGLPWPVVWRVGGMGLRAFSSSCQG